MFRKPITCDELTLDTVTAYNNVGNCKANKQSTYRIISGAGNNEACINFSGGNANTKCTEYLNGGTSNRGCNGGFNVRSMIQEAGNCIVYDQPNCGGRYQDSNGPTNRACASLERYNWGNIKSFKCRGCKFISSCHIWRFMLTNLTRNRMFCCQV